MSGASGNDLHSLSVARPRFLAPLVALLAACGGGGGGGGGGTGMPAGPQPPAFSAVKQVRVSEPAAFGACSATTQSGTLYDGTALEPSLVINPANTANLIAAWQQNRWSNGGSQALNLGASFDGGISWQPASAAFSVCSGGGAGNAGNYLRASNGWLTVSPAGVAYALSLSFTGGTLLPGSSNAQLVARSMDGGLTWSAPTALIADGADFFNDKGSITADPSDPSYVYAVWDRLTSQNSGPSYFAVTADGGSSWQTARNIYDPGPDNQTIGNIIEVLPGDVVVDVFTEIDTASSGATTALLRTIQSSDHGTSWSAPVTIAEDDAVGAFDPQTNAPIRDSSLLFSVAVSPGGTIYVVWQDARFSGGQHDGVAFASSADGGASWSGPLQVNGAPSAVTFTPTINVRADGMIAISYYDLRNDRFAGSVLTDCWMVISSDGRTFKESHLSGPFDLNNAPRGAFGANNTLGLFLGDYQVLASSASAFLPLYAQTNPGAQISSDVFIGFPTAGAVAAAAQARPPAAEVEFVAHAAPPGARLDRAARERVMEHIRRVRAARLQPGT